MRCLWAFRFGVETFGMNSVCSPFRCVFIDRGDYGWAMQDVLGFGVRSFPLGKIPGPRRLALKLSDIPVVEEGSDSVFHFPSGFDVQTFRRVLRMGLLTSKTDLRPGRRCGHRVSMAVS